MKIRYRLILSFALIVGVSFYYFVDWILNDLRPRYLEAVEESLVDHVHVLSEWASISLQKDQQLPSSEIQETFRELNFKAINAQIYQFNKTHIDEWIYITDEKGIVLFHSKHPSELGKDYSEWNDVYKSLNGQYGARTSHPDPKDPNYSVLYVSAPIIIDKQVRGVITVCKPTEAINNFILSAKYKFIAAGAFVALIIIALGIFSSIVFTRPLQTLTRYARQVRDGKKVLLPKLKTSEIKEMGQALEEMRKALDGKQYIESYIQNLTHELKSPIAAISGAAEILEEDLDPSEKTKFIKNIQQESRRLTLLVERMLALSHLESLQSPNEIKSCSTKQIIKKVYKRLEEKSQNQHISLSHEGPDLEFKADPFLIEQCLFNLVDNAIDFSPNGSKIQSLVEKAEHDKFIIIIKDQGTGIPEFALDKVFDRFYSLPRPQAEKKSTGLGLNFVKEIMTLHRGSIKIFPMLPQGTSIHLLFHKDFTLIS